MTLRTRIAAMFTRRDDGRCEPVDPMIHNARRINWALLPPVDPDYDETTLDAHLARRKAARPDRQAAAKRGRGA